MNFTNKILSKPFHKGRSKKLLAFLTSLCIEKMGKNVIQPIRIHSTLIIQKCVNQFLSKSYQVDVLPEHVFTYAQNTFFCFLILYINFNFNSE